MPVRVTKSQVPSSMSLQAPKYRLQPVFSLYWQSSTVTPLKVSPKSHILLRAQVSLRGHIPPRKRKSRAKSRFSAGWPAIPQLLFARRKHKHTCTHIYTYIHIHIHIHTHIHIHIYTYIHTYIQMYIHRRMYWHIELCLCICIRSKRSALGSGPTSST